MALGGDGNNHELDCGLMWRGFQQPSARASSEQQHCEAAEFIFVAFFHLPLVFLFLHNILLSSGYSVPLRQEEAL